MINGRLAAEKVARWSAMGNRDPKQAVTPAVLAGLIKRAQALHAARRSAAAS